MPAAREQAEEWRVERVGFQVQRRDVSVEMVDGRERQPARPGDRLRSRDADEERADQPGPSRHGDEVDFVEGRAGVGKRLPNDGQHELEMAPRRDLGDDASELRVQVGLRSNHVRADVTVVGDERGGRLVARRLERENHATGCG